MGHLILLLILVIMVVGILVATIRLSSNAAIKELGDVSKIHGTARLLHIIKVLKHANEAEDQRILSQLWGKIELPLLEVLADNTEQTRKDLVEQLTKAHSYAKDRQLAKAIMTMRNAALEGVS